MLTVLFNLEKLLGWTWRFADGTYKGTQVCQNKIAGIFENKSVL